MRSVAGSGQHLRAKEGGRVCRHDASHIGFSSLDLETTVTRLAPPAPRGARCSLWDLNTRSQWVKSLCNALALSSREAVCLPIAEWRAEAPRRPVRRAPTLAPPVPSQVLSLLLREGRLLPLVVYETHREDRAAGV